MRASTCWTAPSLHRLSLRLKQICDQWRWKALACSEKGHTLKDGVDWQAPRTAPKKCPSRLHKRALVAVWQGAIRHGKGSMCSRCGQEATLEHVLWKCKWWTNHHPEPPDQGAIPGSEPLASRSGSATKQASQVPAGTGGGRRFPAEAGGARKPLLCHGRQPWWFPGYEVPSAHLGCHSFH